MKKRLDEQPKENEDCEQPDQNFDDSGHNILP
jgi:hypothetical protein